MVLKPFWLQFVFFTRCFVGLAQNDFHRNAITSQIILLVRLASAKKF